MWTKERGSLVCLHLSVYPGSQVNTSVCVLVTKRAFWELTGVITSQNQRCIQITPRHNRVSHTFVKTCPCAFPIYSPFTVWMDTHGSQLHLNCPHSRYQCHSARYVGCSGCWHRWTGWQGMFLAPVLGSWPHHCYQNNHFGHHNAIPLAHSACWHRWMQWGSRWCLKKRKSEKISNYFQITKGKRFFCLMLSDKGSWIEKKRSITVNSTVGFITVVMAIINTIASVAVWDTFAIATGEGVGSTLQSRGLVGSVFHTSLLVGLQLHAIRTTTDPLRVGGWKAEVAAVSVRIRWPAAEVGTWEGEQSVITTDMTDKRGSQLCMNSRVRKDVNKATDQSESWSWKTWHAWCGWYPFW